MYTQVHLKTALFSTSHSSSDIFWNIADTFCLCSVKTRHPSALGNFGEIMNATKGKKIVMFLDYDGTLAPIVQDPDRAFMTDEVCSVYIELSGNFSVISLTLSTFIFTFKLLTRLVIVFSFPECSVTTDEGSCKERRQIFPHSHSHGKVQRQGTFFFLLFIHVTQHNNSFLL